MHGLLKAHIPEIVFVGESGSACDCGCFSCEGGSTDVHTMHRDGCTTYNRYSPFILCISLPGFMSETLMNFLDEKGICVSRSAACKKGARSRTLEAMRLNNDVIDGSLRVSFSRYSTRDEVEYFEQMLKEASETLYKKL